MIMIPDYRTVYSRSMWWANTSCVGNLSQHNMCGESDKRWTTSPIPGPRSYNTHNNHILLKPLFRFFFP